jgi:adenylate cyclase
MMELVYKKDGKENVFPLQKTEVVVGRSPDADLTLESTAVSRFHAKFKVDGNKVTVEDLESRNKTKVNDAAVKRAPIVPGDRVTFGDFTLEVRLAGLTPEQRVVLEDTDVRGGGETIMRSREELARLIEGSSPPGRLADVSQIQRNNRILRALTKVAKDLISEDSLDSLLQKFLSLVFENIPAERGMLGLYEGDELVPRVVEYRNPKRKDEKIVIPKAITAKVRKDKVSILTMDAQQEFDASASILALGIHSAMCVPLWDKDRVIGTIYVDEDRVTGKFSSDDLELLGALANYAAVAIERQRLTERIQHEQATRAKLERYHAKAVVDRILQGGGGDTMEMQERQITVCFTDIVGFTSMSEGLEPREVGVAINELFTELTECIFKYEGTLDKYIGDCIMAVFGAPVSQPDHAVRCVRAALEMQGTLERLNAERPDRFPMQLRTGINSGEVVAGDFGSPKRKDYSVLGDTVNMASRLESQVSQPGWVVIGEATYELVKDFFECEFLGRQTVKGKKREVGAYGVLCEKPGAFD